MNGRWNFYVADHPWSEGRDLYIRLTSRDSLDFVQPFTLFRTERGAPYDIPTLKETREDQEDNHGDVTGFLQGALEVAWSLGMRPASFADHTNELKAVRYHLEDMRSLAKVPPRPAK